MNNDQMDPAAAQGTVAEAPAAEETVVAEAPEVAVDNSGADQSAADYAGSGEDGNGETIDEAAEPAAAAVADDE